MRGWLEKLPDPSNIYKPEKVTMQSDNIKVIRWSEKTAPDEAMLRSILADEDLHPYMWSNGPGDVYGAHDHSYHKVIYVVRGSITFGLPDAGDTVTLNSGDRLELPAGVRHDAVVGPEGVACLEAHR
jgi:quercetin dioxygenase-like cupin family protein